MSQHVVPLKTYIQVFVALMILMFATVAASSLDLGMLEVPVAMAIALVKTLLILVFFMHLKFNSKLTWLFTGASVLFLAILAAFLTADFSARHEMRLPVAQTGAASEASAYFDGPIVPDHEHVAADEGAGHVDHE